jgi:hypothetical protein
MIIKCILLMLATFLTGMIWFHAVLAAYEAATVRIKKDQRRGPQ